MEFIGLLGLLALSSCANGAALYTIPETSSSGSSGTGQRAPIVRSGVLPNFSSNGNSGSSFETSSDENTFAEQPGQSFLQSLDRGNPQSFESVGQDARVFIRNQFPDVSNGQADFVPKYEEHERPLSGLRRVTTTITPTVTRTHTLRVPSTSDVWVTSVTMMKMPVTQLTTQRSYVPVAANTVTSVIRITKTPIEVVTRTEEIYPTKTLVSVYTRFVTETETVELWQNIVHRATNYEVLTVPVIETQTLLQRLFATTTVTRVVNVTSLQPILLSVSTSLVSRQPSNVVSTAAPYYADFRL